MLYSVFKNVLGVSLVNSNKINEQPIYVKFNNYNKAEMVMWQQLFILYIILYIIFINHLLCYSIV